MTEPKKMSLREIDAMVAEKIFGLTPDFFRMHFVSPAEYTGDSTSARIIVKMCSQNSSPRWDIEITNMCDAGFRVRMGNNEGQSVRKFPIERSASMFGVAICLAALAAVGVNVEVEGE